MKKHRPLLDVKRVSKYYRVRRNFLDFVSRVPPSRLVAVDDVSFSVDKGTVLGVVG